MPAIQKDLNPLAVRVGEKIRTLRKAKGMKQYTLASEAGYESRSTITAIENGIILPSLDKAIEIAHILGVEVATLVEEAPVEAVVKSERENEVKRRAQHGVKQGKEVMKILSTCFDDLEVFVSL